MKPEAKLIGEDYYLNAAGVARLVYETDERDIAGSSKADLIRRFKAKVDGWREQQRATTGALPSIDAALAANVDFDRFNRLAESQGVDAAMRALFVGLAA